MARTSSSTNASGVAISVTGLNETVAGLRRLGVDLKDLKEAWEPIGQEAERRFKDEAPKRAGDIGGSLRKSIRSSRKSGGVAIRVGGINGVDYAAFVMFGVPSKGMAPNRFDKRALENMNLDGALEGAIRRAIVSAGLY